MKKLFVFLIGVLYFTEVHAQDAYIEVKGEPDLMIFLNNQFKGKTSVDLGIFIIENVKPGTNLIKVVKEGYVPFEENITVKPGEVLAYKVKPFSKNVVTISQTGNTEETDKKVAVKTGKLVIQSVPIGISITMPNIEGVTNSPKTKDLWTVENISEGSYSMIFKFNNKTINKTIDVPADSTTNVFVNMMNGEVSRKITLDAAQAAILAKKEKFEKHITSLTQFFARYGYREGMSEDELKSNHSQEKFKKEDILSKQNVYETFYKQNGKESPLGLAEYKLSKRPSTLYFNKIVYTRYYLIETKDKDEADAVYDKIAKELSGNLLLSPDKEYKSGQYKTLTFAQNKANSSFVTEIDLTRSKSKSEHHYYVVLKFEIPRYGGL